MTDTLRIIERGPWEEARERSGERNVSAKLTEDDVHAIRAAYRRGVPGFGQIALGRRFGVGSETIRRVITGETWSHLPIISRNGEAANNPSSSAALSGASA